MQQPIDVLLLLADRGRQTDAALAGFLSSQAGVPKTLGESIAYSLQAGGKRLRPTLVLEWFDCLAGRSAGNGASSDSAIAAACAIELIHTFSLVHDDLPAMDDDDLRRGRPTNHKVFGEAVAILAGDAMTSLAFQVLAERASAARVPALVAELARATGPAGMIGGQAIDIASENAPLDLDQLRQLHAMKTGALLTVACRMGAIAAGADESDFARATAFGNHVGLAFQIMDDVLDVTSTPQQLGKATGKDQRAGKNTYPGLLGLDASKSLAAAELECALAAIEPLQCPRLRSLARFVCSRAS